LGSLTDISPLNGGFTFYDLLQTASKADPFPSKIVYIPQDGTHYFKRISLGGCEEQNEQLYYHGKHFLPDYSPLYLHILQQHHETPWSGHCCQAKTYEIIAWEFI
jgi:hypothetical protein